MREGGGRSGEGEREEAGAERDRERAGPSRHIDRLRSNRVPQPGEAFHDYHVDSAELVQHHETEEIGEVLTQTRMGEVGGNCRNAEAPR
ncbi:hypothetical protein ACLOJK_002710 [Asimina triloba]